MPDLGPQLGAPTDELDPSVQTYDADKPVQLTGTGEINVPRRASGEDSMLATLIEHENPSVDVYQSILDEYETQGASEVVEGIRIRSAEQENQRLINEQLDNVANGELTLDQAEELMAFTAARTPDDIKDLHRETLIAQLMRTQAKTAEEKIVAEEKWHELVEQGWSVQDAIQKRVDIVMSRFDSATPFGSVGDFPLAFDFGTVGGVLADALPFATTTTFVKAFNEVFPDAEAELLELPRGELAVAFRERMALLSPGDQFRIASQFMDAVIEDDGLITGHAWQSLQILHEALDPRFGEAEVLGTNVDRTIGNVISALDVVGMAGVAKQIFRLSKSMFKPGTPLNTVNIADLEAAEKLAAAGIKKDLSDGLNMTPADIVEVAVSPKPLHGNIDLLPANIAKQVREGDAISADVIQRTEGNPLITTVGEQNEARRNFRNEIKKVGNQGAYGSSYTAQATDTGMQFTAMYGKINSKGVTVPFSTPREAVEAAAHNFPEAKNIRVYQRKATGELAPVKVTKDFFKTSKRVGEYTYEVDGFKTWAHVDSLTSRIFFGSGDVVASGPTTKWTKDPASRFSQWISRAFGQSGDQARGVAHQINQIALPFSKLKNAKKREVVLMLQKYAQDPKNMNFNKLVQMAQHDDELVSGFLSYRKVMDTLYELENRNLRGDMLLQGAKHLVVGDFQSAGVKLSGSAARNHITDVFKTVEVFDPLTKQMVKLDGPQIEKLYAKGSSLYRTREPIGELSKQTDLVMVTNPTQVRQLPLYVLNKIDGYVPRYYKDTYFVQRLVNGTKNGRATKNQQILRAAGDKAEANQAVKQLLAEGKLKPDEVSNAIIHDRTMSPSARATVEMDDRISLGRMFYHTRADQRLRGIDGLAEVSDPVEAMIKNIDSTSKYVSEFELLTTMKDRFMNTWGTSFEAKSVFPATRDDLKATFKGNREELSQAQEMWDHIHRTESISTFEGELWRDTLMDIVDGFIGKTSADTFWGTTKTALSTPVRFLANNSPNKLARSLAFTHLIALNPFRQGYVQSQQFAFLSALAPKQAPKFMLQGQALNFGVMTKQAQPKIYAKFRGPSSKAMGMSTKEYDEFIDGYMSTGLPHSVDSHDYVANTLAEFSHNIKGNMFQRGARQAWNIANVPVRLAKKIGFNYGELSNLSSTFLLARHRFLQGTGKKALTSPKDWATVAGDARNLALDMTRTGAFRYQEGGFSALTQFLSIQHKAALAISPFKHIGNQAFTRRERVKLLAGQIILNGAAGVGVAGLYMKAKAHLGIDFDGPIEKEVDRVIIGGLYETTINQAMTMATGEDVDLNISGSVSPASGINQKLGDFYDAAIGQGEWIDTMAFTNVANRYVDAARSIQAMRRYPELTGDDQIIKMISAFGGVTSGWNQALRARVAMRLGVHVTNSGSPTVQSTFASSLAEGLLGIQDRSMENLMNLQEEYSTGLLKKPSQFDSDRETTMVADQLYKDVVRIVTLFGDEFDPDIEGMNASPIYKMHVQRMNDALSIHMSVRALYDPIERDRIWQKFSERAQLDRTSGRKGLIDKIIKMNLQGDLHGHKAEYAINRIRQSGLYDKDSAEGREIEHNIKTLMDSMNGLEKLSDSTLEGK